MDPLKQQNPSYSDREAHLRDKLNRASEEFAPAWRPEVGDELVGIFEGWSQATTSRGEVHPVATIETSKGERLAFWVFHAVARDEMKKIKPRVGELLAIRRLADRVSAAGAPYKVYRVVVDREEEDALDASNVAAPTDQDEALDRGKDAQDDQVPPEDEEGDWRFARDPRDDDDGEIL